VVRFKNKHALAAVKRWFISISTISSSSQTRETVPLGRCVSFNTTFAPEFLTCLKFPLLPASLNRWPWPAIHNCHQLGISGKLCLKTSLFTKKVKFMSRPTLHSAQSRQEKGKPFTVNDQKLNKNALWPIMAFNIISCLFTNPLHQ